MDTTTINRGRLAADRSHETGTLPVAVFDVFYLRCEARADLVAACLMDFRDAVDGLQAAAVRYGLVTEIGQDGVQAIMAEAFRRAR